MRWTQVDSETWRAGAYRVYQLTRGYSAWLMAPGQIKRVGEQAEFDSAKRLCETHAKAPT